jgi:hypothetical protein
MRPGRHIRTTPHWPLCSDAAGKEVRGTSIRLCSNQANQGNRQGNRNDRSNHDLEWTELEFPGRSGASHLWLDALKEIEASCHELAKYLDVTMTFHQSNLESALVGWIQSGA